MKPMLALLLTLTILPSDRALYGADPTRPAVTTVTIDGASFGAFALSLSLWLLIGGPIALVQRRRRRTRSGGA